MKKSRIQKRKHTLVNKKENKKDEASQPQTITRQDMDRMIFDMVTGELYENSDINALHFDDIMSKYRVQLPMKERERLWDILVNSIWVSPTVGFGQSGKLELTTQGFQMMSQYGTYSNYLAATQFVSSHPLSNDTPESPGDQHTDNSHPTK